MGKKPYEKPLLIKEDISLKKGFGYDCDGLCCLYASKCQAISVKGNPYV